VEGEGVRVDLDITALVVTDAHTGCRPIGGKGQFLQNIISKFCYDSNGSQGMECEGHDRAGRPARGRFDPEAGGRREHRQEKERCRSHRHSRPVAIDRKRQRIEVRGNIKVITRKVLTCMAVRSSVEPCLLVIGVLPVVAVPVEPASEVLSGDTSKN